MQLLDVTRSLHEIAPLASVGLHKLKGGSQEPMGDENQRPLVPGVRVQGWGRLQRRDRRLSLKVSPCAKPRNFTKSTQAAVLKEELAARGLSTAAFALKLRAPIGAHFYERAGIRPRVPPQRIQEIVAGKRAITPETALRIGAALGTGARLWLAMQQAHDLRKAEIALGAKVRAEVEHAA